MSRVVPGQFDDADSSDRYKAVKHTDLVGVLFSLPPSVLEGINTGLEEDWWFVSPGLSPQPLASFFIPALTFVPAYGRVH